MWLINAVELNLIPKPVNSQSLAQSRLVVIRSPYPVGNFGHSVAFGQQVLPWFVFDRLDSRYSGLIEVTGLAKINSLSWVQGMDGRQKRPQSYLSTQELHWVPGLLDGRLQKLFEPLGMEVPPRSMTIDETYSRY